MTDHPTHDYDGQAVSNRLGQYQRALDESLDGVLDIEAGLREILIHSRHDTAVDALGAVLNTEAGLADVLQSTAQPQAPDAAGTHRRPPVRGSLPALSPADRMGLRDHPDVQAAQRGLVQIRARVRVHLSYEFALNLASNLARGLIRDLDRDLDRNHDHDSDPDFAFDLARIRESVGDLDAALRMPPTWYLDRTLAQDLNRYLDRVHERARARARGLDLDFVLMLDRILDRIRDFARILDFAGDLDSTLNHDRALNRARYVFVEIRSNEVCRAIGLALRRESPVLDAASVSALLDDFTHDDLRDTDLRGIDFSGVHWSPQTRWPPAVDIEALKARSDETPPGSGIWIVRSGTTTVRDFGRR
ncbi:hypothetical protein ACIBCC_36460 [Streptomyces griseus]|uniref:hypothetical protein n=1 Tax=Streptomyces griseus TaxID=1911 RepID=UPI0037A7A17C